MLPWYMGGLEYTRSIWFADIICNAIANLFSQSSVPPFSLRFRLKPSIFFGICLEDIPVR